jgi:hypothetical protein
MHVKQSHGGDVIDPSSLSHPLTCYNLILASLHRTLGFRLYDLSRLNIVYQSKVHSLPPQQAWASHSHSVAVICSRVSPSFRRRCQRLRSRSSPTWLSHIPCFINPFLYIYS